jgi:hypothetical protein
MFIVTYFTAVCFKEIWCRLPKDGEIIAPKQAGAVLKTVCINYSIVPDFTWLSD